MRAAIALPVLLLLAAGCATAQSFGPRNPTRVRVALCQMPVVHGDPEANMAAAEEMIWLAAQGRADVAVFPECMRLGWAADDTARLAEPIPGPATDRLARLARRNRIYIVAGLAEKTPEGIYNSAVLIDPAGRILLVHRKNWIVSRSVLNVDIYEAGRKIEVVDTPLGPIALLVCADSQRELSHRAAAMLGARMVFVPGSWAAPPEELDDKNVFEDKYIGFWKRIFEPASKENKLYIFGVNGVGTMTDTKWAGRELWGVSLAYGPGGKLLGSGKRRATDILFIDVPLEP